MERLPPPRAVSRQQVTLARCASRSIASDLVSCEALGNPRSVRGFSIANRALNGRAAIRGLQRGRSRPGASVLTLDMTLYSVLAFAAQPD